jgi:hypothetical protein
MWTIKNRTAYSAERNWIRDKDGRHHWVVAVKATFDILSTGALRLADEQPSPTLVPEYAGEPGRSSLLRDSDLLYAKPCTDVIVEAHAHAPNGRACSSVRVALRIDEIHKELLVHGDRRYVRGLLGVKLSSADPFVSRPIRYEWSFGGEDCRAPDQSKHRIFAANPIGKGFAVDPSHLVDELAPAIEQPGVDPLRAGPIGMGPIDAAWSPRRERAGTFDASWEQKKKPLLPDDYDELYASCAPADQRADRALRGGEAVILEGMSSGGNLRFVLPKIYLTYRTRFGRRTEDHRGHLTTVYLMPEISQVVLVWQSTLFVAPRDGDYLDETTIAEKRYLT